MERLRVIKGHLSASSAPHKQSQQNRFRFTREPSTFTEAQREFYEENGYVVIPKLVPEDALRLYAQRFRDLCEGKVSRGQMSLVKDGSLAKAGVTGERLYNKVQDFMWDDVLFGYCSLPQIVDLVRTVTGPNVMAMHTMLINKPPDAGTESSRHPLHQDLHYFPFRPADRIVCAWTAMEEVRRENGCLLVLPGSHRGPLLPHDYPGWENGVNKLYHGVKGYDEEPRLHLEMGPGDTVLFHPLLIHGSGANRTQGFRKAISCHYAASECNYIDVKGTTQENIALETEGVARKRGVPADYISIWKYRGRLVRGESVNL